MFVIFSHGHLSSPQSHKIQVLSPIAAELGFDVEAIDYTDLRDDPHGRVERLTARIAELSEAPILVGSSLGGLVSLAAAERHPVSGLFLMAPALFMEDRVPGGVARDQYQPKCEHISLVHGWDDDIIPWQNSLQFARERRVSLHLIDADHRLEDALPMVRHLLREFLHQQNL